MHSSSKTRKSEHNVVHSSHRVSVVVMCLGVGALHFLTGPQYQGPCRAFVNGYLIDILLPMAMTLLLGVQDIAFFRKMGVRVALVFGIGATSEILQFFGVPLFGRTFDPLDFLAFGAGIGAAAVFEKLAFLQPIHDE